MLTNLMEFLSSILIVIIVSVNGILVTRLLRPRGLVDSGLTFFLVGTGLILITGYLVSYFRWLDQLYYWLLFFTIEFLIILLVIYLFPKLREYAFQKPAILNISRSNIKEILRDLFGNNKEIMLPLAITIMLLGLVNLYIVFKLTPHDWDSMEYHLSRMAYYLQEGSFRIFPANYWAQVVHPKNTTVLQTFLYLISNRNENFIQFLQYGAYWVSTCSVYGIARSVGLNRRKGFFSASVFGLLIVVLMEATITGNDLQIAAFTGVGIYFLYRSAITKQKRFIWLAAISIGLGFGVKFTMLFVVPSLALIAIYALFFRSDSIREGSKRLLVFTSILISVIILVFIAAGYLENTMTFGHPLGPSDVQQGHTFFGQPIGYTLINGTKNLLRYGLDFTSLDGLKGLPFQRIQMQIRNTIGSILSTLGIDLEAAIGVRFLFDYTKLPSSHETFSYFGIFGFVLIWPVVLITIFKPGKSMDKKILGIAAILFILVVSYGILFEPHRGRFFITGAVIAAPLVGDSMRQIRYRLIHILLVVVVFLGCISALAAVFLRDNRSLFDYEYKTSTFSVSIQSALKTGRLEQLSSERSGYYQTITHFEKLVPKDAVVAITIGSYYHYPLFGENLTRTLEPVKPFWLGMQDLPEEAEFLLFDKSTLEPEATDILLGIDKFVGPIYLRKLK